MDSIWFFSCFQCAYYFCCIFSVSWHPCLSPLFFFLCNLNCILMSIRPRFYLSFCVLPSGPAPLACWDMAACISSSPVSRSPEAVACGSCRGSAVSPLPLPGSLAPERGQATVTSTQCSRGILPLSKRNGTFRSHPR